LEALGNELVGFLAIDIEDDVEILDILKREIPILEVANQDHGNLLNALDLRAIYDFIKDWNEEYCQANDLCPICRTKLVENIVDVSYGDTSVPMADGLSCPVCG
jgi:hypothetical protein